MDGLFDQKLIEKACIMVVGCGALGNEVLKNLALMGACNLIVVDFDRVEPANLSRSVLFTAADALQRTPKVEAVRQSQIGRAPAPTRSSPTIVTRWI